IGGQTTTAYTVNLYRNAALRGADQPTTPLDPSVLNLGTGARYAALGEFSGVGLEVHEFTLDLTGLEGRSLEIAMAGLDGSLPGATLQLLGTDGVTVLGTGGPWAANFDLGIDEF